MVSIAIPAVELPADIAAEWVRYDDTDPLYAETIEQFEQFDLATSLRTLREAADVTVDGTEEVAGVATTRYVGDITTRELLTELQGMDEDDVAELAEFGGPQPDDLVPVTVLIDDDGLVRQVEYRSDLGGGTTTQRLTVLEYGLDVRIEAPPADATISGAEFEEASTDAFTSEFATELELEDLEVEFEQFESSVETFGSSGGSATATAEPVPAPSPSPAP